MIKSFPGTRVTRTLDRSVVCTFVSLKLRHARNLIISVHTFISRGLPEGKSLRVRREKETETETESEREKETR